MAIEDFDQVTIEPAKLRPFSKFIMSIGELPTSYLDSLSYAEQVTWFCDYLQNHVIPALNNNASALEEVQTLMTELQEYVDNYFTNLDVQEEINNKLDQMASDGSLYNIIRQYTDPIITEQNNRITNIDNKVDAVANGSPLVASSVAGMTNTDKTYVNTSDGYWYYYNGTNWVQGGVYQTSGIADNSIDILMLNEPLKSNFNEDFTKIEPVTVWDVYYYENTTTHKVQQNNGNGGYSSYILNLEIGKTYLFSGFNRYQATGIVVVDVDSNVIYSSLTDSSITEGTSMIFNVKDTGMKAYISRVNTNSYPWEHYQTMLCVLNDVYSNVKIKTNLDVSSSLENYFIRGDRCSVGGYISYSTGNGYTINAYRIAKGLSYKVISADLWYIPAYIITDLSYKIVANHYTEYKDQLNPVEYTFTAENDGYIFLPTIDTSTQLESSIEIVYDTIEIKNINDNLYGKKVLWNGDSIAYGAGNSGVSYCNMIANTYNMDSTKYAVSGRCIAKEDGETSILETIPSMSSTADFVIFEGGWNDMWRVPLGDISEGFNATLDEYTWSGALESLIKQSKMKWPTARIGFILAHGKANNESEITRQNTYWDRAIEIFNKWHLPYIDLRHNGLVAFNDTLLDMFFQISQQTGHGDGTHPNALGYRSFYNIPIASWMNTL